MKHILILISILLLSCPVIGEDTGILFFREVEGKWLWFEDGNKDKDVIYRGEFKDGWFEDIQPNGQGSISYPNGRNYDGEWKDGKKYGQGTLTIPNGEKDGNKDKDVIYRGEFKEHSQSRMEKSMLGNSRMEFQMVKEQPLSLMEESMWGNTRIIKEMVKEHSQPPMEKSMLGNSRMEFQMVKEQPLSLMEESM